jgi:hypothetical protein
MSFAFRSYPSGCYLSSVLANLNYDNLRVRKAECAYLGTAGFFRDVADWFNRNAITERELFVSIVGNVRHELPHNV